MQSGYSIGSHFEGFVKEQVASGPYASASEVIRDALRLLEEREAHLRGLRATIQEGAASGPGIPPDEVFDRLEAKYAQADRTSRGASVLAPGRARSGGHRRLHRPGRPHARGVLMVVEILDDALFS